MTQRIAHAWRMAGRAIWRRLPWAASGQHQRSLREAEGLLRMAAQVGRLGAWRVELERNTVFWSDQLCAILEFPDVPPCSVEEALAFCAPRCRAAVRSAFTACARDGSPFDLEVQIVTAKRRRRWLRAIGEAVRDADGRVVRVQGAVQDIQRSRSLVEENERLQARRVATLEGLTDAFFTCDAGWKITFMNLEAERLLGRSRKQLVGRELWAEFPDSVGSEFHRKCLEAVAEQRPVEFEGPCLNERLWARVRASVASSGLHVSFSDQSARRRAEQDLIRLNGELEARVKCRTGELERVNAELEAFTYSVAHDLRSPLRAILGFAQFLLERPPSATDDVRGRRYLERIRSGALQMEEMTDALLEIARLSHVALRPQRVDLARLARESATDCAARYAGRAAPEFEVPPTLEVRGDAVLLRQVIDNLIGNAWKFSARASRPRIVVGMMRERDGRRVFYVRDNGVGFDMAYASRLFEPFYRLHRQEEFEGTGVGLASVRKIVRMHGGDIWAEAVPEQGATFYFTLNA